MTDHRAKRGAISTTGQRTHTLAPMNLALLQHTCTEHIHVRVRTWRRSTSDAVPSGSNGGSRSGIRAKGGGGGGDTGPHRKGQLPALICGRRRPPAPRYAAMVSLDDKV